MQLCDGMTDSKDYHKSYYYETWFNRAVNIEHKQENKRA
jgi:hypothetical protein